MIEAIPGIQQDTPPERWQEHRFGLSPARWEQLAGMGVWVTGGGTGFGRAMAIAAALAGARVFVTGRRRNILEETLAEAIALGANPSLGHVVPADLCDEPSVRSASNGIARYCAEAGTPFRAVVHCAALPQPPVGPAPLANLDLPRWDTLMRTNVTAPWLITRSAVPLMLAQGAARVVLFSSEAGWASTPTVGAYNVSKAALNSLGASLAAEFAASHPGTDLQLNVLIPGEARSEMNQGSTNSPYTAACMTLLLLSQPSGGPNGFFFHRDGRYVPFAYTPRWHSLLHQS